MLRDNLAGLIEPMRAARELNPLALFTEQKKSSDDRPQDALKIPAPKGRNLTLTENAASPFHAEPRQLCAAIALCTAACRGPVSEAPIIDQYKAAACIPFSPNPKVSPPHTREWETPLTLSDGLKVTVSGAQIPGGRIHVRYLTTGRESVAADAGDYVYPSDVRLNAQVDLLYVKASGLAG